MLVVGINEGRTRWGKTLRDGSCVIVKDGSVIQAISEERVTRQKYAGGYNASFSLLCNNLNLTSKNIDLIVTSSCCEEQPSPVLQIEGYEKVKLISCNHHLSHAYSTFFSSPFENAIVIVLDAGGNTLDTCESLPWFKRKREQHSYYLGTKDGIKLIRQDFINPKETGIGELYRAFTYYLGWPSSRFASNTMALAGLGDRSHFSGNKIFREINGRQTSLVENNPQSPLDMVTRLLAYFDTNIPPRNIDEPFDQNHKDLAAWLQSEVEDALINLTDSLIEDTGVKNVCLTGGVAYNCKAVGSVIKRSSADHVFVNPVSGDHGQALGNAIYGYHQLVKSKTTTLHPLSPYLGPEHDTSYDIITKRINYLNLPLAVNIREDIVEDSAKLLYDGAIIGWFQNRSEFGPRALGNRSICASPATVNIKNRLNKIKNREEFMPLAPAILEEKMPQYFKKGGSSYMSVAVDLVNSNSSWANSVTHIDGTSRIQVVKRDCNKLFYDLIDAFQKKSGIPMILNTSFNGNGEPIVETVDDALECFNNIPLDYLIIGDSIISKNTGTRTVDIKVQCTIKVGITYDKIWDTLQELMPNIIGKKRTRFLLFDQYVQWVKEGKKQTTIRFRRGSIDYPSDISLPILATDDFGQQYINMVGRAIIKRIEVKQFSQLTQKNANDDGFSSLNELKNTLQEIYGKIEEEEFVTIYSFYLVCDPNEKIA